MIRDWVRFNITSTIPPIIRDDDYDGSLFAVKEIDGFYAGQPTEIESSGWDCLGKRNCHIDEDGTFCKTFEPLMDAARVYLNIELVVFGLLILWHKFLSTALVF